MEENNNVGLGMENYEDMPKDFFVKNYVEDCVFTWVEDKESCIQFCQTLNKFGYERKLKNGKYIPYTSIDIWGAGAGEPLAFCVERNYILIKDIFLDMLDKYDNMCCQYPISAWGGTDKLPKYYHKFLQHIEFGVDIDKLRRRNDIKKRKDDDLIDRLKLELRSGIPFNELYLDMLEYLREEIRKEDLVVYDFIEDLTKDKNREIYDIELYDNAIIKAFLRGGTISDEILRKSCLNYLYPYTIINAE